MSTNSALHDKNSTDTSFQTRKYSQLKKLKNKSVIIIIMFNTLGSKGTEG